MSHRSRRRLAPVSRLRVQSGIDHFGFGHERRHAEAPDGLFGKVLEVATNLRTQKDEFLDFRRRLPKLSLDPPLLKRHFAREARLKAQFEAWASQQKEMLAPRLSQQKEEKLPPTQAASGQPPSTAQTSSEEEKKKGDGKRRSPARKSNTTTASASAAPSASLPPPTEESQTAAPPQPPPRPTDPLE